MKNGRPFIIQSSLRRLTTLAYDLAPNCRVRHDCGNALGESTQEEGLERSQRVVLALLCEEAFDLVERSILDPGIYGKEQRRPQSCKETRRKKKDEEGEGVRKR